MGQIYLVRHGQASFGSADYDQLSPLGVEQGRLLGEWFAHGTQKFHQVVTGSLKRHRQTADACISALPKRLRVETEWQTDAGFNEYNHDEVLVRHRPDFAEHAAMKRFLADAENPKRAFQEVFEAAMMRWMSGSYDAEYGETWSQFRERCVAVLKRLVDNAAPSQNIIVFTSGGPISALCQHVLALPDTQVAELSWTLANSAVTKLYYQRDRITLGYLNNYAHLEWLGEANAVTYR